MTHRILLVGAGGTFGLRLARRAAASVPCTLLVAGRSLSRAQAVADALRQANPAADIKAIALDRETVTTEELRALGAFIVIDAAGPFQGHAPHLAQIAIAAGSHFIDIADARDYVANFPALDETARAAQVLAVTGASSTPALSNAVLDALTKGWQQVEAVSVAISPGNRAPRGLAVVEAILSYAGKPVRVLEDRVWRTRPGWGQLRRQEMPGLGRRWLSLCETPDLDIIPARFPGLQRVSFLAGLELAVLHLGLWALSLPVRAGLLRSLAPSAAFLTRAATWFEPLGSDRGGMMVDVTGRDAQGRAVAAKWWLVAQAGDGPNIPVLPALALVRRLVSGVETRTGAQACTGLLTLAEIEAEFSAFQITSGSTNTPR